MLVDVQLGPFLLQRVLGRGAMGEVWLASHRQANVPVAVKVLTSSTALDPTFVAAFLRETEVVAGLSHPHIVQVHDVGVMPAAAGALAGSPYLVMEAGRGTLGDIAATIDWAQLRAVLVATLSALSHAHARGVVHRDIKPANILLGPDGWLLADFGVALTAGRGHRVSGSPAYMPPEQASAGVTGPWTDLYALAVTAWELTTGRLPFTGDTVSQVLQRHAVDPLPTYQPRLDVPAELEGWLRGLLAKSFRARPQRAADALAALEAFGPALQPAVSAQAFDAPDAPTTTLDWAFVAPAAPAAPEAHAWPLPPLGPSWRRPARWGLPLPSTGLGILALRQLPVAGRDREQDALWTHLREVSAGGGPRRVDLVGLEGAGRGRLARWLGERAHEVGHAHLILAERGLRDGLRRWGAGGFSPRARAIGAAGWVVDGLSTWLVDGGPAPVALLLGFLEALASDGRVVVVLAPPETAALDTAIARAPADLRLLVLATPSAATAPTSVSVPPLSPLHMDALLRDTLALEAAVADAIAKRAAGLPGVALGLIHDLAEAGVLEAASGGFVLAPGATFRLPDADAQPWLERAARVGQAVALERLAVLDAPASPAVVELTAVRPAVRAGVVREEGGLVALAHPALRLALLDQARAAGRLTHHHRWAASIVADPVDQAAHRIAAGDTADVHVALLEAGQAAGARRDTRTALRVAELLRKLPPHQLSPLQRLEADWLRVLSAVHRGQVDSALPELLDVASRPWPDPDRHIQVASSAANILRLARRLDEARRWMDRALAMLDGYPKASATSRRHVALNRAVLSLSGPHDQREARVLEAVAAARAEGNPARVGDALNLLGWVRLGAGDVLGAIDASDQAIALDSHAGVDKADQLQDRSNFLSLAGRLDEARAATHQSIELARQHANPRALSGGLQRLALLDINAGEYASALEHIDAATMWGRRVGQLPEEWQLLRAHALGGLGRTTEARALLAASTHVPEVLLRGETALLDARDRSSEEVDAALSQLLDAAERGGESRHPSLRQLLVEIAVLCERRGLAAAERARAAIWEP